MTIKTLTRLTILSFAVSLAFKKHPYRFYCHFRQALQSVCFRTLKRHGIWGVSRHNVFAYEADPRVPYYESCNWQPDRDWTYLALRSRGEWPSLENGRFPWPVEAPVKYEKVTGRDGQPGYLDVNFTDYDGPRRFRRLMPVSVYDIPLKGDSPEVEFVAHYPTEWKAILRYTGEYSWLRRKYERLFQISFSHSGTVYNFTEAETLTDGIVKGFRGIVDGEERIVEAFFFELPAIPRQYALMLTSGVNSYILYRTDEVGLRDHDILCPGLRRPRSIDSLGLPRYGAGPPSYEEATGIGDSPEHENQAPAAEDCSYTSAIQRVVDQPCT